MTDFTDHQPGQPYQLTREQFLQFAGLAPMAAAFAAAMEVDADRRGQEPHRIPERAFWAAVASFEASREFNPLMGGCGSDLAMDTHGDRPGCMVWRYWTTSGTIIEAAESRNFLKAPDAGYPGWRCTGDLPEPAFMVTIPAERDQPGRYHYEQLRSGGSYCE